MSATDFLGNTMAVGDKVIYSPKGGTGGELVLAEVIAITETVKDRYGTDPETGKYGVLGTYIKYSPTLQPIRSTATWRTQQYKRGQGYVPVFPRKVRLQDMSSVMLYKKARSIPNNLMSFITVETDRTIESDQYSHQEEAYYSGVYAAVEAVHNFFHLEDTFFNPEVVE